MKSLSQLIYEEMQEKFRVTKYRVSCTLSTFFSIYSKSRGTAADIARCHKESRSKSEESFLKNLNMYSDGGPRDKEEWLSTSLSSPISLDIYKGYDGTKERVEVLIHTKQYDDMKMCFYLTGSTAREWSETGKAIYQWGEENKNKHLS